MSSGKRPLSDANQGWAERIAAAKDELRAVVAGPPPKQLPPVQLPYPVRDPPRPLATRPPSPLTQPPRTLLGVGGRIRRVLAGPEGAGTARLGRHSVTGAAAAAAGVQGDGQAEHRAGCAADTRDGRGALRRGRAAVSPRQHEGGTALGRGIYAGKPTPTGPIEACPALRRPSPCCSLRSGDPKPSPPTPHLPLIAHLPPWPEAPPGSSCSQAIGPDPSSGLLLQQPLNYLSKFQARPQPHE